jgi:hypothetical protein
MVTVSTLVRETSEEIKRSLTEAGVYAPLLLCDDTAIRIVHAIMARVHAGLVEASVAP